MYCLVDFCKIGRLRMTIRELANTIGVSPATISIVLNGKKGVGEDTRERVLKALKENN